MAINLRAKEGGSVNNVKNEPVTQASKPQKDLLDVFRDRNNRTPSQNPNKNKSFIGKFMDSLDRSNVGGANSPFSRQGFDENKRKGIGIKDDLNKLKEFSLINALINKGKDVAGAVQNKLNPQPQMPFASGFDEGQPMTSNIPMQNMKEDPSQIRNRNRYRGDFAPEMMTGMNPRKGGDPMYSMPPYKNFLPPNVKQEQLPPMSGSIGSYFNKDYLLGLLKKGQFNAPNPPMGSADSFNYGGMVPNNISIEEAMEAGFDNIDDYMIFLESQQDPAVEMGFDPLYDNDGGVVYANKGILELMMTPFDDLTEQEKMLLNSFSESEIDAAAAELSRQEQMSAQGMNSGGYAYNRGTPYIPDVKPYEAQNAPAKMEKDNSKEELASAAGMAAGTAVGGPVGGTVGSAIGSYLFNQGGHVGPLGLKSRVITEKVDYAN